jgi:hypothetical protein
MSLSDAIYTLSGLITMIPLKSACPKDNNEKLENINLNSSYALSVLSLLLSEYFTSCLALFNILIEIVITCQRIGLISRGNRIESRNRAWLVCATLFAASLAIYTPVLFINEVDVVETISNQTTNLLERDYTYRKTEFGKSTSGYIVFKIIIIFRVTLVTVVLSIVNVIASVKFTSFFKRKHAIKKSIRGIILNS